MNRMKLSAALMLMALSMQAQSSEILELQDYHASEAGADKKGPWLGLQQSDHGWRLVKAQPSFKKVPDPIAGEGVRVSSNISNAKFLLSAPGLKAGSVSLSDEAKAVDGAIGDEFELSGLPSQGQERLLHFKGHEYKLQNRDGKIYLSYDGAEQFLFDYVENKEDNNAKIIWVGDLDHDGKLDFIFDASNHYNVTELRLYLSGQADKGDLLKLVAKRKATGC